MIVGSEVVPSIQFLLSVCFVFVLLYYCWHSYHLDKLRQDLFELRDELFDYARSGAIGFDAPAYRMLRTTMNGIIRFGHRITFLRLILAVVTDETIDKGLDKPSSLTEWMDEVNRIPSAEVREKLLSFHSQMGVQVVRYMFARSQFLKILVFVFALFTLLRGAAKGIMEAFAKVLPGLDLLEDQALEAQEQEIGIPAHRRRRVAAA